MVTYTIRDKNEPLFDEASTSSSEISEPLLNDESSSIIEYRNTDLPAYSSEIPPAIYDDTKIPNFERKTQVTDVYYTQDIALPVYDEVQPSVSSKTSSACTNCSKKSSYFGLLKDSKSWNNVYYQINGFVLGLFSFISTSILLSISLSLFPLFPICLTFAWVGSTLVRTFGLIEIRMLSQTRSHKDLCTNCSTTATKSFVEPDIVIGSKTQQNPISMMFAPLKDGYTWRCIFFFLFIRPFFDFTGFALVLTGFSLAIIFPTIPASLYVINKFTQFQRFTTMAILNVKFE
ncbi:hypothetical protein BB558_006026 [Smittium angustum]|uniref:Sensor domain-containing protein n=1 Tax=Smittium angustum TaxID=133377 RepID=A0A2U1IYU1_SMIAN|nr:hypothetical protein BB558_006026 [Smittium angustum]